MLNTGLRPWSQRETINELLCLFCADNTDRFLIYLFLSIAVGIISVLLIVILGLCFGRYWRRRHSSKELTVGDHVTQSSTQTANEATASLMAANAGRTSPGTEMVHYDQTDSVVQHRPVAPSRANGNASLPGNSVRFAPTDSYGQQGVNRRTGNVGPTTLNLPQYQIASSSDSTEGDDRVERPTDHNYDDDDDDYRSNTLGRFYSNPYRHDSYRADEYRTLQNR